MSAELDSAQRAAHGDMAADDFRRAAHEVADLMADYLRDVERYPVLPKVTPAGLRELLLEPIPEEPQPLAEILADYRALIEPNITHWQHPGFFAYFASTGSAPGILGEMLMSTLIANAMLWRTAPVATELEQITVDWLRAGLGLPASFDGLFTDTASTSSLIALAAARQTAGNVAAEGLAGHPPLRIYASSEAHSSIEKAAMTLGLGRAGVRRIATNDRFEMRVPALEAAIEEDRGAGMRPCGVVATIGTTSTTSVDPTKEIAAIAAREGLWLHVDAAYAGAAALIPDRRADFAGWELADSIVVNPHKWLFTPMDCSLLVSRRMEVIRSAFSLVPEYLRTTGGAESGRDYNEYTPQLGRRFRALKMWMLLRYFGLEGLRSRIAGQIEWAQEFAGWVDADADAQRMAPVPFSTVCFRWRPARHAGHEDEPAVADELDLLNERLLAALNDTGEVFLSHTRLHDRFTLRAAFNNLHSERRHIARTWDLVRQLGREIGR